MFDLERLRALHAVSVCGSVRSAADLLHVTPSAVSQQLTKLERQLGQTLIERNGRGIRLTDAGLLLAGHAETILTQVRQAAADLEDHRDTVIGTLRIGAFATAARGICVAAIVDLARRHPRLTVRLGEAEPEDILVLVDRGELDVGIAQDWPNVAMRLPDGMSRLPLLDDTADLIVPVGHRLAERELIELVEAADERWVIQPKGQICHSWLMHTLRSMDIEPDIAHVAAEYQTQVDFVSAGLGVSVIPRMGRTRLPDGVRAVPVRPRLLRRVYAVTRREAANRPAVRAVLDVLRTVAKST